MSQSATLSLEETPESTPTVAIAVVALLAGHAVIDALATLVPSSLGLLEVRVGMTPGQSAWLMGLGPLVSGLSQPLCALISDRQQTRFWGVVGLAVAGIAMCSLGLAGEVGALMALYFVAVVGVGMFHPVAVTTVGFLHHHRRNRAVSLFFVSGMLGGVFGAFAWPRYLTDAAGFDYLPLFMLPVLLLAVVTQRSLMQVAPPKLHEEETNKPAISRSSWVNICFLYVAACMRFCVNTSLFYLFVRWSQSEVAAANAAWSKEEVATAAAPFVGNLNSCTFLGMAFGGLVAGHLIPVGREKLPMVVAPILFAPVIALFPLASLEWGYVLAGLAGIGFASMIPINIGLAQKILPHRANFASSLMMGGAWSVAILGPPLAEYVASQWSLSTAFYVTASGLLVSGVCCLPLRNGD